MRLRGSLKGIYLSEKVKEQIVLAIQEKAGQNKVVEKVLLKAIELCTERYSRWIQRYKETGRYVEGKPGPRDAPHALLKEEKQKIIEMAGKEEYVDLSHRQLAVVAGEKGIVDASASSFYREMKASGLQNSTKKREVKNKQNKPEVNPNKPNEIWNWDLTYIALGPIFVYLFAIIDIYSKKMVGWHLSFHSTIQSMKTAWDKALMNEGLISVVGAPQMPQALSDHGVQMAKKTAKQFFRDLGISQLFARYQTPKDNAWIESWFRILKHDWLKYKDYVTFDELEVMLGTFIEYYNNQRYHGSIEYVTPSQKHNGEADRVLAEREVRKDKARQKRLEVSKMKQSALVSINNEQERLKEAA